MPPISQKSGAASHRKIGGTFRGNQFFLLTREALAYGRGQKCTEGTRKRPKENRDNIEKQDWQAALFLAHQDRAVNSERRFAGA